MQADADAVSSAIDAIDGDVVVVAHSYGGVPVTQGASSPRVRHLVYIAAFALDAGESLLSSGGGVPPAWWHMDGGLVSAGDSDQPPQQLFFGDVEPHLADEIATRLLPQSFQAFTDRVSTVAWRDTPSTYVITERDAVVPLSAQEAFAARSGSASPRMDTSHSPFLSQPEALATIIETAAAPSN
jgi:pimeloyl-ACP methyl ester carboxylesterase